MIDFDKWIFSCNIEFINGHLRYWGGNMLTICFMEGHCYPASDEYEKVVDLVTTLSGGDIDALDAYAELDRLGKLDGVFVCTGKSVVESTTLAYEALRAWRDVTCKP